jgi:ABC-type multidrug transport system ATPase subunit
VKLLAEWTDGSILLEPDITHTLGRDLQCDIRINSPKVSRVHLTLKFINGNWNASDLNSSNGTYLKEKLVQTFKITKPTTISLGGAGGVEIQFTPIETQAVKNPLKDDDSNLTRISKLPSREQANIDTEMGRIRLQNRIRIGRDPANDWVIPTLSVSRFHAEISQNTSGNFDITDLKSSNGTFVNGEQVTRQQLNNGDLLTFGPVSRRFTSTGLEPMAGIEGTPLEIVGGGFFVKGRALLEDININLEPRSLTAIIGPSGAGKTTLLNLISGRIKSSTGKVLIGGVDVEKNHKFVNQKIGFVPQADILHTELTSNQAITYGAQLRLPSETSKQELNERVQEIVEKLELTERKDLQIKKLSGGQKKRASIALELITSPEILVLDEPTSGLDPGLDSHVMETLRELADEGQTVVLVTHSVDNLNYCDNIILMASGGHVAYFGPASSVLSMLGKKTWSEVFRWLASPEAIFLKQYTTGSDAPLGSQVENSKPQSRSLFSQVGTLCSRYLRVIMADRFYSSLLVLVPILTGLLCYFGGGPDGFGIGHLSKYGFRYNSSAQPMLLMLVLGSVFIGLSTAIQEVVKETVIRKREQATGVKPSAYLASKVLVLGLIVTLQTCTFALIVLFGRKMPTSGLLNQRSLVEIVSMTLLLGFTSMTVGLLVSSCLSSPEQSMPALVGITMIQIILSGALPISLGKILLAISHLSPSYWATNGIAATTNMAKSTLVVNSELKIRWEHSIHTITQAIVMLSFINLIAFTACLTKITKDRR